MSDKSITSIVFRHVHETRGIVDYDALTADVMKFKPESKWDVSHWNYFKSNLIRGRYEDEINDEERDNLRSLSRKTIRSGRTRAGVSTASQRSNLITGLYPNKSQTVERDTAMILAKVAHHMHPRIIKKIAEANAGYREIFASYAPPQINVDDFLYDCSACVFPGVRRHLGRKGHTARNQYVSGNDAIIDDNVYPRHIWSFLSNGTGYNSHVWKTTNLNTFELCHIFAHKPDERRVEQKAFLFIDPQCKPYGLFTCAANVVLVPAGLVKPTDGLESVQIAFFKRHIDLYGTIGLPGIRELNESLVPEWYGELDRLWNQPILPPRWEEYVEKLLAYRDRRLRGIFAASISRQETILTNQE